jgi:outer membrane protein assembly factor BamB
VWTNDGVSFSWRRFPHPGSWALSGLSPQGHLVAVGDKLIVPGSRYTPGVFDRRTGEFLFYADGSGPYIAARGRFAFAGGRVFEVNTGYETRLKDIGRPGRCVLADDAWHTQAGVLDPASIRVEETTIRLRETTSPNSPTYPKQIFTGTVARLKTRVRGRLWLRARSRLVTSGRRIQIFDISDGAEEPKLVWEHRMEGSPSSVLAANGKLIVVTIEGQIHCFGAEQVEPRVYEQDSATEPHPNAWAGEAGRILKTTGVSEGHCLVWGLRDGGLVEELVRQSRLHVIAADRDPTKVDRLRRRLDAAGLYGTRAAGLVADPLTISFAPYLASLIVSEDLEAAGFERGPDFVKKLFFPIRPYGGVACLRVPPARWAEFTRWVATPEFRNSRIRTADGFTLLERLGPLPGSADWCGQNADPGNTRCSRDELVKAPLGVLWFGSALSNKLVLPKHGEGPVEQVVGGRLFIEGPDSISATDVYTGRLLWTRIFAGLGGYYDITKHQRGAHAIGSNFYTVPGAVYVAAGRSCHILDPASGRTLKEFQLPLWASEDERSDWLFLLVYEDLLIAGFDPIVERTARGRIFSPGSSKRLVVMDRRSGRVLWTRDAAESFGHYGVVAGSGKVFVRDRVAPETLEAMKRRGTQPEETPHILALDARTGKMIWKTDKHVTQQLSYSEEHDILLCGATLRGKDGSVVWAAPTLRRYAKHPNPALDSSDNPLWWGKWGPMLRGRTIFTQGQRAFELLTGAQKTWRDADGREREWRFRRSHGCGPIAGSQHLLTFRSGCAGFFDLEHDGGTGNLGGFRSGCTSNLIAANGVLNAPDYTRACGCAYQNRSSLALVHMPEVEYWTFGAHPAPGRLGLNFGAPGDRRAENGTLWLDVPSVGGPSPDLPIGILPEGVQYSRHHSSWIRGGEGLAWVAASGMVGARRISIPLPGAGSGAWTVCLHFAEPLDLRPGERVFSVTLQGREVMKSFDIVRACGGARRAVIRAFEGIAAKGALEVTLTPADGSRPPLLCGVEVVADD